jgi:hypothetical protein
VATHLDFQMQTTPAAAAPCKYALAAAVASTPDGSRCCFVAGAAAPAQTMQQAGSTPAWLCMRGSQLQAVHQDQVLSCRPHLLLYTPAPATGTAAGATASLQPRQQQQQQQVADMHQDALLHQQAESMLQALAASSGGMLKSSPQEVASPCSHPMSLEAAAARLPGHIAAGGRRGPAEAGTAMVLHVLCNGVAALYKVDTFSVLLDGCVEFTPITFEEITGGQQAH